MTVIPAINETSFLEVEKKIKAVQDFGLTVADGGTSWVHLDVSDGKFTPNLLWNNPNDLSSVKGQMSNVQVEVHLMVQNPDAILDEWLDAKVKRLVVHLESVRDLDVMKMKCAAFGTELFLAISPDTPAERLFDYEIKVDGFLILAVKPGLAGQKFQEDQLEKIKILRRKMPDVKIEVDGGVNLENAPVIKNAGADILISASAIWESENSRDVFKKIQSV